MNRKKKLMICGILVIGLGAAGFWAASATGLGRADTAMGGAGTVVLQEVMRGDMRQAVTANGTVELASIEPIYSSAHGETRLRVAEVLVEVGDFVEAGQPIVLYDIEEELISLNDQIASSAISMENQRLGLVAGALGPSPTEYISLVNGIRTAEEGIRTAEEGVETARTSIANTINQIQARESEIDQARRTYEQNLANLSVNRQLLAIGGITQQAYDELAQTVENNRQSVNAAENALDGLILQLEANERAYDTAVRGVQTAIIALETAQVNYNIQTQPLSTERAQVERAQAQNSFASTQANHAALVERRNRLTTETSAHAEGTVTEVEVTQGAQVTGTSVLVRVADFSELIVTAQIREFDSPHVYVGQSAVMTTDALPGSVYTGTVIFVSPTATTRQATVGQEIVVPIRIRVDNPDEQLRPGYSVDLELVLEESEAALMVSLMSVIQNPETGQDFVFVVEGDSIRQRYITRGLTTALEVEVVDGLEEGDVIILTPTPYMQDGDPVPEDAIMGGMQGMGGPAGGAGGGSGGGVIIRSGGGGGVIISN